MTVQIDVSPEVQSVLDRERFEAVAFRKPAFKEHYFYSGQVVETIAVPDDARLIVRPIPPIPDGVFYHPKHGEFYDNDGMYVIQNVEGYEKFKAKWESRSAEFPTYPPAPVPPKQVPLGPEDVIANVSVLDFGNAKCGVVTVNSDGVTYLSGGEHPSVQFGTWKRLMDDRVKYSKCNTGTFAPCSKPA